MFKTPLLKKGCNLPTPLADVTRNRAQTATQKVGVGIGNIARDSDATVKNISVTATEIRTTQGSPLSAPYMKKTAFSFDNSSSEAEPPPSC